MENKVCVYCRGSNESCNFCGGSGYVQSSESPSRIQKTGRKHNQARPKKSSQLRKAVSKVNVETPIKKWTDNSLSPYDNAKSALINAMRLLNEVSILKNSNEEKYANTAKEALNTIKEGRDACEFESLRQSWERLFKTAFYHMKNAETLYNRANLAKKSIKPAKKSKTLRVNRVKSQPNSQETVMELKLRELGFKKLT